MVMRTTRTYHEVFLVNPTPLRRLPLSALLLAATLALPALAVAGEARVGSATLRSTPFATKTYGPGVVSGQARLVTNAGTGTTSVVVCVEGLRPGSTHIAHIHRGGCDALLPGTIIHNLGPLVANARGIAVDRTVIQDSTAGIDDCEWWVAVHEGFENTDPQSKAIAIGPVLFVEPGS